MSGTKNRIDASRRWSCSTPGPVEPTRRTSGSGGGLGLGSAVGVGSAEGEGSADGSAEGETEGSAEGRAEGWTVGEALGPGVGDSRDGVGEPALVGSGVGDSGELPLAEVPLAWHAASDPARTKPAATATRRRTTRYVTLFSSLPPNPPPACRISTLARPRTFPDPKAVSHRIAGW